MKMMQVLLTLGFAFSTTAFADEGSVPEFFYQSKGEKGNVEAGVSYTDYSMNGVDAALTPRVSAMYGLTHGLALEIGASYTMQDVANVAWDGMNNFNLNVIGHTSLGGAMDLHYGVMGSVTPSKDGMTQQRYSQEHAFNPYLGLSFGEHCKYGLGFTYKSLTTSGDVWGNFNYDVSLFGEWGVADSYLVGLALTYDQISGTSYDNAIAKAYGRVYMGSVTLLPILSYTYNLDGDNETAIMGEIAARFHF